MTCCLCELLDQTSDGIATLICIHVRSPGEDYRPRLYTLDRPSGLDFIP